MFVQRVLQGRHWLGHGNTPDTPGQLGLVVVLHHHHLPGGEGRAAAHHRLVEGGELSEAGDLLAGGHVVRLGVAPSSGHLLQSPDAEGQSLLVSQPIEARVL